MAQAKQTAPATISAEALATALERGWRQPDGSGPRIPGIRVRSFVRDHADEIDALSTFADRPAFGGNRVHVYSVPEQTDPIVRGLAARMGVRAGVTLPLTGAVAAFVKPDRKAPARKATARKAPAARKRPQGGTLPPQSMAPAPEAPTA